jgi:hypothetical protein
MTLVDRALPMQAGEGARAVLLQEEGPGFLLLIVCRLSKWDHLHLGQTFDAKAFLSCHTCLLCLRHLCSQCAMHTQSFNESTDLGLAAAIVLPADRRPGEGHH